MTGSNNGAKTWARPQLVRVGRIGSIQAAAAMGVADGGMGALMKS